MLPAAKGRRDSDENWNRYSYRYAQEHFVVSAYMYTLSRMARTSGLAQMRTKAVTEDILKMGLMHAMFVVHVGYLILILIHNIVSTSKF